MNTALIIVIFVVVIVLILAACTALVCAMKLQMHEDKFADIEKRLDNISEAGRLQDERIRNVEQYINKKK